jgi:hypothetical protein
VQNNAYVKRVKSRGEHHPAAATGLVPGRSQRGPPTVVPAVVPWSLAVHQLGALLPGSHLDDAIFTWSGFTWESNGM